MTEASPTRGAARDGSTRSVGELISALEIDTRLLGMIGLLAIIWVGFNFLSNGLFLTTGNLWNLSVQSSSVAIMATGMVLIIVSRNIDLSVGSLLGFCGYTMAMVQAVWIPQSLGLGFDQPYTWLVALAIGLVLGIAVGALQGFIISYGGVPAFIVTLGGFLVWRGLLFEYAKGQTIAPMDKTFSLIGGGPVGSLGEWPSWILGFAACAAIAYLLITGRRKRRAYGFPVRPTWAMVTVIVLASAAVLGAIWIANNYFWPAGLASQYAREHNIAEPPGGLQIPVGVAFPVLIMIAVTVVMTIIATRRRFGRYVFAIGGNPDAALLGGINVRMTIVKTYILMGILCAISAAIQTARLNAGVTSLGVQAELDVISAAVIGGTSFAGGIGTIPGAILGAVVMQSLRSGMQLLNIDSPTQDIVVGAVLVGAVFLDSVLRRRSAR